MPEFGALLLGIADYPGVLLPAGVGTLKFPARDADALESYLRGCWPQAPIQRIPQEGATPEEFERAFTRAAHAGPYELFLIYLSGHGLATEGRTGFLLQPDGEGRAPPLLTPATLDRLLHGVHARRLILILDCCFAEAVVAPLRFFDSLNGAEARLFIASSRADQQTWEADEIGHGIFTALLLDCLRTGVTRAGKSHRDSDRIDVDTELFPYLCEQVPLIVLDLKHRKQEPVKGGTLSSSTTLPRALTRRSVQRRTAFATAMLRVRQISLGISVAVAIALVLAYVLIYRAEIDTSGEVVLVNGPSFLQPVYRVFPHTRVHTGIHAGELDPDSETAYQIRGGTLSGLWTQVSLGNYRRWFDQVTPALGKPVQARYLALMGIRRPEISRLPHPFEAPPSTVELVAWTTLATDGPSAMPWLLQAIPGLDRTDPLVASFRPARLDFAVLDLTPTQVTDYAAALRYLAASEGDSALPSYLGFLKAIQEWLFHHRDGERWAEARPAVRDTVAAVITTFARHRKDEGAPALPDRLAADLLALAREGYFETAGLALSQVADGATREELRTLALQPLHRKAIDGEAQVALQVLARTLDGSSAAKEAVLKAQALLHAVAPDGSVYETALLLQAARSHSLPSTLIDTLLTEAEGALRARGPDFMDGEHARILAAALTDIAPEHRETVYKLIRLVASDLTPRSGTLAEIYGALGAQRLDPPRTFEAVVTQTRSALQQLNRIPHDRPEPLPGLAIGIDWPAWPLALAEFAQTRPITAEAIQLLRGAAVLPSMGAGRTQLIAALVQQDSTFWASCRMGACVEGIRRATSSAGRELEASLLATKIGGSARPTCLESLAQLRLLRAREIEPETRIALGDALVSAQLAR